MKLKTVFKLFAVISFSVFSNTSAEAHLWTGDTASFLGSDWAKANPGKLPFEECHVEGLSGDDSPTASVSSSLLFVSEKDSGTEEDILAYIVCSAPSIQVAYKVPVYFSYSHLNGGFYVSLVQLDLGGTIKLQNMDGKTVDQVLGYYRGTKVGGGIFFLGGAGSFLKNENQVKIRSSEVNMGNVFSIEKITMSLKARDFVELPECLNAFVLLGNTQEVKKPFQDCTQNEPYGLTTSITAVDVEMIKQLRFVKIKGSKK